MNSSTEIQSKATDIIIWICVALLSAAALVSTYYYTFSGSIQAIIWLAWFVLTLFLAYFTTTGKKIVVFAREAKIELLKVVWPTRQETIQTTTIVMVMVTFTGFVLWGIDSIMMWAIAKITHLG